MEDSARIKIRVHGTGSRPALVYLPGIHGDWTLVSSFRERITPHERFVEFIYPRTLTWSLDDYAQAVLAALAQEGIGEGFLIGESFGSAIAWQLLHAVGRTTAFQPTALLLAGGFVRYPFMPLVNLTRLLWSVTPPGMVRRFFAAYAIFARWRHRHAPETAAAIHEFIERRTAADLAAMGHRLELIRRADPRPIARQAELPVYQLSGLWDPVVCHPAVRAWLRRHCPGYRESRLISNADHNVLGTAPEPAARQVREWVQRHAAARH